MSWWWMASAAVRPPTPAPMMATSMKLLLAHRLYGTSYNARMALTTHDTVPFLIARVATLMNAWHADFRKLGLSVLSVRGMAVLSLNGALRAGTGDPAQGVSAARRGRPGRTVRRAHRRGARSARPHALVPSCAAGARRAGAEPAGRPVHHLQRRLPEHERARRLPHRELLRRGLLHSHDQTLERKKP